MDEISAEGIDSSWWQVMCAIPPAFGRDLAASSCVGIWLHYAVNSVVLSHLSKNSSLLLREEST